MPKTEEHVQDIKTELKSNYSASGRRVKRLQRNEDELTSGITVKKHISFVTENPTNCSSLSHVLHPLQWRILFVGTNLKITFFAIVYS